MLKRRVVRSPVWSLLKPALNSFLTGDDCHRTFDGVDRAGHRVFEVRGTLPQESQRFAVRAFGATNRPFGSWVCAGRSSMPATSSSSASGSHGIISPPTY